jgi:hypothetical protein
MNWLTSRLSELNTFSDLARSRVPTPDPNLGLVPFSLVRGVLSNYQLNIESEFSLDQYFLLVEDAGSAAVRAAQALSAPPDVALPPTFTRALDDGEGTVLYLPDGLRQTTDFQLFGIIGQQFSRVRASGQFDEQSASLRDFDPPRQASCSDGPCAVWGTACGDDCVCMKFEVERDQHAVASLPSRFLSGGGHTYELRCVRVHNA